MVTADYIAVIDGSTSKANRQFRSDMRNGRLAMIVLSKAIRQVPSHLDCAEFCNFVTEAFKRTYTKYGIEETELSRFPENRLTASTVIYSNYRKEIWMIGDCQCMIDNVLYENPKPAERPNAEKRASVIRELLKTGETIQSLRNHDLGRDAIIPAIIDSCKGQNIQFSVIDGTPISMEHVRILSAAKASEIVLATDGYPYLKPTLAQSEKILSEIIKEDPLLIGKYKATKGVMLGNRSFDDRCYVRFSP